MLIVSNMDDRYADRLHQPANAAPSANTVPTSKAKQRKPVAVDLFCGAGGMSLGFKEAGFDVRVAIDIDPINVEVHKKNFPNTETIEADLSSATGAWIR